MTLDLRIWELGLLDFALPILIASACAEAALPLASHRAAYEISLSDTDFQPPAERPNPDRRLWADRVRISRLVRPGYASNFRQPTELQRNEGNPVSSDIRALTFEDGDGKSLTFQIDSQGLGMPAPPIAGSAARGDRATPVKLTKPTAEKIDIGTDVLFPTQHVERIIAKAREAGGTMEARVYDGSDTGKKVFATLTVIGKEATSPGPDAATAEALGKMRRWPVSVSYFDELSKDAPPEYVLSFDLYENGVSGTLKLDYGAFVLTAKLSKLEWLPTPHLRQVRLGECSSPPRGGTPFPAGVIPSEVRMAWKPGLAPPRRSRSCPAMRRSPICGPSRDAHRLRAGRPRPHPRRSPGPPPPPRSGDNARPRAEPPAGRARFRTGATPIPSASDRNGCACAI